LSALRLNAALSARVLAVVPPSAVGALFSSTNQRVRVASGEVTTPEDSWARAIERGKEGAASASAANSATRPGLSEGNFTTTSLDDDFEGRRDPREAGAVERML
jgi:hypothetical protein